SSAELTNTRSSQMIGVAAEVPGSGAAHFTFLFLENSAGRFFSVLEPLKKGPRHCGQFSPQAETARAIGAPRVRNSVLSVFIKPIAIAMPKPPRKQVIWSRSLIRLLAGRPQSPSSTRPAK